VVANNGPGYTCEESVPKFGDEKRACDEGPIRFTHEYTCGRADIDRGGEYVKTVGDVSGMDNDTYNKLLQMNLTDNDQVCVFKPKVQVLDNWEWCNGVVSADDDTYKGYYGSGRVDTGDNDCASTEENAFTPYKGYIIVIPPLNEEE